MKTKKVARKTGRSPIVASTHDETPAIKESDELESPVAIKLSEGENRSPGTNPEPTGPGTLEASSSAEVTQNMSEPEAPAITQPAIPEAAPEATADEKPAEEDSFFPIFSEVLPGLEEEAPEVLTPPRKKKEKQKLNWAWLPGILLRPAKTIRRVLEEEKPNWLLPMLIISLMVVVNVVLSGPAQRLAIQTGLNIPEEFQYWSTEQQESYMNAQASKSNPIFVYFFPILSGVAGWWVVWMLTASILHLMITLAGSRTPRVKANNLVAWSMLPFAIGLLIKGIAIVSSNQLLAPPPLAGLIAADAKGASLFLKGVFSVMDAYWLWHAILLLVGAKTLSKLSTGKALGAVTAVIVLMLLMRAIPTLIGGVLSNMSGAGAMF